MATLSCRRARALPTWYPPWPCVDLPEAGGLAVCWLAGREVSHIGLMLPSAEII